MPRKYLRHRAGTIRTNTEQMKTNPSQTMIQVRQISLLYYNLGKKASS